MAMNKEYTISGLSKSEVVLLDTMWDIDGYDEYIEWKSKLDTNTLRMVEVFEEMLMLADIDDVDNLEQAQKVIESIK